MRHIAAQDDAKVPRDSEFKFKDRAQALVNKWHQTINPVKANGANGVDGEEKGNGMEVDGLGKNDSAAPTSAEGKENGAPAQTEASSADPNAMEGVVDGATAAAATARFATGLAAGSGGDCCGTPGDELVARAANEGERCAALNAGAAAASAAAALDCCGTWDGPGI